MPQNQLKGKFKLDDFMSKVEKAKKRFNFPRLEYLIGEGETLDYLFDALVTFRPLHGNKSIELTFKGERGLNRNLKGKTNLAGEILYLDIDWLTHSEGISKEVKDAIAVAKRKKYELMEQEYQSHQ